MISLCKRSDDFLVQHKLRRRQTGAIFLSILHPYTLTPGKPLPDLESAPIFYFLKKNQCQPMSMKFPKPMSMEKKPMRMWKKNGVKKKIRCQCVGRHRKKTDVNKTFQPDSECLPILCSQGKRDQVSQQKSRNEANKSPCRMPRMWGRIEHILSEHILSDRTHSIRIEHILPWMCGRIEDKLW